MIDHLTEDANFGKKNYLFRWSSFWSWRHCCIWGTENQHAYIENPTHPKRVTVWCGFWSKGIIGPFFFENEQLEAVTVNAVRYRAMLNEFLFTKIEEEVSTGRCYLPHSRSYTRCFAPCFWRSHYQPQSWCRLATSELRFDTVGLLFAECRQRYVLRRQVRDNWRFKAQYSWSHW